MAEEKKITHPYLIFVVNPKVTRLSLPAALTIMGLNSSKQGLCFNQLPAGCPESTDNSKQPHLGPHSHPPHVELEFHLSANPGSSSQFLPVALSGPVSLL